MKFNTLKNKAALVAAMALVLMAFTGFATATEPIAGHPEYTIWEVIDACEDAYSTQEQVDQCVINVCGFYGCSI